jgi:hypothetical protein
MIASILLAVPGLLTALFPALIGYFQARANSTITAVQTSGQVAVEMVRSQVEQDKIKAAIIAADRGWWLTRWMKPAIFYPCAFHFAAVIADSLPLFGHAVGSWHVAALPSPMDGWEGSILLSVVVVQGFKSAANVIATALAKNLPRTAIRG